MLPYTSGFHGGNIHGCFHAKQAQRWRSGFSTVKESWRQVNSFCSQKCISLQLTEDLNGKKIGLVTEGFDTCEPDVVDIVKGCANKLTKAGAVVEDVSIPMHADGMSLIGNGDPW